MKLQKILRLESGFSLIEITVAIGLLGLASLAVMNLSDNVNTSTKRAETLLSRSQFTSALANYAQSALACLEYKGLGSFGTSPKAVVFNNWKVAGVEGLPNLPMQSGRKFKNFSLQDLSATMDVTNPGLAKINISGQPGVKTFLKVLAIIRVRQNSKLPETDPASYRDYSYHFNIPVLASTTGVVASCADEKTLQESCESMNGTLNTTTGKCDVANSCLVQGAFQLLSCTPSDQACDPSGGNTSNNPTTGTPGCPQGSLEIQTGMKTWSHIGTCGGKKCTPPTVTDVLTYFSCLKCPTASP
jgi:type II secretory pathway pseudopilin PulG